MRKLSILKVGGAIVENPASLGSFLDSFHEVEGPKILVHGGGRSASELCGRLGIPVKMVDGRRITDKATLEVAIMTYGGLVNRNIVAALQHRGENALGLSGADLACIKAVKRASAQIDYGYVGDVREVNADAICRLLESGVTPVFAPLSFDGTTLLNTTADSIAAELAAALADRYEVSLRYCFEKEGVLDKDGVLIRSITPDSYLALKSSAAVSGGMIPKIDNAFASLGRGVREVFIGKTLVQADASSPRTDGR